MFGPSNQTKTAVNSDASIADKGIANSTNEMGQGTNLLNLGQQNTASGTNYMNTMLNGNQENTAAAMQPDINRIREGNQNAVQTASTLMPRGGGRSATLFQQPFKANAQISNLFNGGRTQAATGLAQIGQGQTNAGAGMFGLGNNALNTSANVNANIADFGLKQQQQTGGMYAGLGSGLMKILTMGM